MIHPANLLIVALRRRLSLTQATVARLADISRVLLAQWECGLKAVPERHLPALASALQVTEADLGALCDPALRACGAASDGLPRLVPQIRPHYARIKQAPLSDMLELGPVARRLNESALQHLGTGQYQYLRVMFPRDTIHELLLTHHAAAEEARLHVFSPRQLACTSLIVSGEEEKKWVYQGDAVQPALVWQSGGESLVLFGQVTLGVPMQGRRYRVDFLMLYVGPDKKPHWMYLELDGNYHAETAHQDARRADGLGLPEIRFENSSVLRPDFFHGRLLPQVRRKAKRTIEGRGGTAPG